VTSARGPSRRGRDGQGHPLAGESVDVPAGHLPQTDRPHARSGVRRRVAQPRYIRKPARSGSENRTHRPAAAGR
jgi:hypothetical protein